MNFFDCLSNELSIKMSKGSVALCGDFNARTADKDLIDYTDNPNVSYLNKIPRKSNDQKTNDYGYKLLDICLQNNIAILNGRDLLCATNGTHDYTCYNHNGRSTVDYLIADAKTTEHI